MPAYTVTLKRYVEQKAKISVTVPDGMSPLSGLPDLKDPNISWVEVSVLPLSHDVSPVADPADNAADEAVDA